jgi:hypothetical protein
VLICRGPLLVVPEARLLHLGLEVADAAVERGGIDVLAQQRELLADRRDALG